VLRPWCVADLRAPALKRRELKAQVGRRRESQRRSPPLFPRGWSSARHHTHAPVHRQPLAGDVFAGVGRIQHAQALEVFIVAQTLQAAHACQVFFAHGLQRTRPSSCWEKARADAR